MTNIMLIELYKMENNITCPLHTYTKWKSMGYQVKKGEKAQHKITIWKHSTKKVKDENNEEIDSNKYFPKLSCFFTIEQVEKVKV